MFDTASPTQGWVGGPSLPGPAREAMGIAAIGSTIYVFGGLHMTPPDTTGTGAADARPWHPCADAYAYDADGATWRRLPDVPFPCYGWQASVWGDRYIILAAGVKESPVGGWEGQASPGKPTQPNDRVLVYDAVAMRYRELPTRLPPAFVVPAPDDLPDGYTDAGQRELARKYVAAVRDVSKTMDVDAGGFRISPGLSLIGTTLYMAGGECLTPHAGASDELLVGRMVTGGEGSQ